LVSAIEDRCSRLPIDVNVRIGTALAQTRLPTETEAAAYFFTAEALNNVIKHSQAIGVDVALYLDGTRLSVEVKDDGVGFDPNANGGGSGSSGLGNGTVIAARLPIQDTTREPS
jgi:signal transduction histidine kinase